MKIVTISTKDLLGGAARVAYRLHEQLIAQKIDNTMVVNQKRSSLPSIVCAEWYHDPKSTPMQLWAKRKWRKAEQARLSLWDKYPNRDHTIFFDLEISLLKNTLSKLDFDLLHMHWVGENYVDFTELQTLNKPIVWTLHDCFPFTGICSYFEECNKFTTHCSNCPQLKSNKENDLSFHVFEQKLERYANLDLHIVCPSNWMANNARKSALLCKYPIQVIPNGIDTNFFHPISKQSARESLGMPVDKKTILFGGISVLGDKRKGGLLLLEALTKFKEIYTCDDIHLVILGTEKETIDFGLPTTYFGYVQNEKLIRILYSAADLTVVPSMYENLPTIIMESMACGRPVVAFNIGGNVDMIDHQTNGYLATAYDTTDMAYGLKYCLDTDNETELMTNARQKVVSNFGINDITNRYVELYKSLTEK